MNSVTVSHAKNNLSKLINSVESGEKIHIKRNGKPVAVIISEERYQQLSMPQIGVFSAIMQWRSENKSIELTNDEVDSWRDHSKPVRKEDI